MAGSRPAPSNSGREAFHPLNTGINVHVSYILQGMHVFSCCIVLPCLSIKCFSLISFFRIPGTSESMLTAS